MAFEERSKCFRFLTLSKPSMVFNKLQCKFKDKTVDRRFSSAMDFTFASIRQTSLGLRDITGDISKWLSAIAFRIKQHLYMVKLRRKYTWHEISSSIRQSKHQTHFRVNYNFFIDFILYAAGEINVKNNIRSSLQPLFEPFQQNPVALLTILILF